MILMGFLIALCPDDLEHTNGHRTPFEFSEKEELVLLRDIQAVRFRP